MKISRHSRFEQAKPITSKGYTKTVVVVLGLLTAWSSVGALAHMAYYLVGGVDLGTLSALAAGVKATQSPAPRSELRSLGEDSYDIDGIACYKENGAYYEEPPSHLKAIMDRRAWQEPIELEPEEERKREHVYIYKVSYDALYHYGLRKWIYIPAEWHQSVLTLPIDECDWYHREFGWITATPDSN